MFYKNIHQNYKIKRIEMSLEELCEGIWDLFYNDLALFLSLLSSNCKNKKVWEFLKNASVYIEDAWDICEKYMPKENTKSKHSSEVKWINIDKKELAIKICSLKNKTFEKFLLHLSLKISRDSYADKMRGREILSNNLKWCASSLIEAYRFLKDETKESSNIKEEMLLKIYNLLWLH